MMERIPYPSRYRLEGKLPGNDIPFPRYTTVGTTNKKYEKGQCTGSGPEPAGEEKRSEEKGIADSRI